MKVVRGDNEFDTSAMNSWCLERGIRLQLTETNESSSNSKIERRHRTVFDGMRAMMFDAPGVPRSLWSEALVYQSWLRNRLPTRANADSKSPIEMLTGNKPDLARVIKFGQKVTMHIKCRRMDTRKKSKQVFFLGFDDRVKGCRVFIKRTKRVEISQHVQALYGPRELDSSEHDSCDDTLPTVDQDDEDERRPDAAMRTKNTRSNHSLGAESAENGGFQHATSTALR